MPTVHRAPPVGSLPPSAYRHWYAKKCWRDLREQILTDEPLCRECQRAGHLTPATDVDHIHPHRGRWTLFMTRANLQSLCKQCHSRKTANGS